MYSLLPGCPSAFLKALVHVRESLQLPRSLSYLFNRSDHITFRLGSFIVVSKVYKAPFGLNPLTMISSIFSWSSSMVHPTWMIDAVKISGIPLIRKSQLMTS